MTATDRIRWDNRYLTRPSSPYPDPDPLLFQYTPPVIGGRAADDDAPPLLDAPHALDLACGIGQNGLWLAAQGYTVDLIDISRAALMIARQQAAGRGLRTLNFLQRDLDETALQTEAYDLVCVFRFLQRDLFERIRASVKPGGRVIYMTFLHGSETPAVTLPADYLLRPGELAGCFADWRILHQRETADTAEIAAVKPVAE